MDPTNTPAPTGEAQQHPVRAALRTATARVENGLTAALTSPVPPAVAAVIAVGCLATGRHLDGAAALMTAAGLTGTWASERLGRRQDARDAAKAPAPTSGSVPSPPPLTGPLTGPGGRPVSIPQQRRTAAVSTTPGGPNGRLFLRPGLNGPGNATTPEEAPVRWTLTACHIDIDVWGWELEGDHYDTHDTFDPADSNADITAALDWAEGVIGRGPLAWVHSQVEGFDRWQAGAPDPR
ncbi:hypothetical protein OG982_06180 [Streptomyces sp. NBC_01551]|uniref:hypothetical protein n=1 Tax=Streptomyces sp. NBC_01551 TaxID=2975876 RepID=UPI002251931E|nr:hypothetical protein [Streptomyces sp. NBC_01551]MCX4525281.1 hypothetical protein [Streptomyces sp. NBC_01551]